MKRWLISLLLCVLISLPCAADVTLWGLMNPDVATARVGVTDGNWEGGFSAGYMDDLRMDDVEAYRAGVYGLWIINPNAQFPLRGIVPGAPEWIPETIPVKFYIGGLLDMEFRDHKLMPALVGGGMIDTKAIGSLGVEAGKTFNATDWGKLADTSDGWGAVLFLRAEF